jgi:hypothetical protein
MGETDPLPPPARADSGDSRVPRPPPTPTPRSNRGFWIIAAALVTAGVLVVAGAVLTRPRPPGSNARLNLERAVRAANIVLREGGSYAAATADEVGVVEVSLSFVPGDRPSDGPTVVSVHAERDAWIGAALASDGSCRSVRVEANGTNDLVVERDVVTDAPCSADAVARASSSGHAAP